MSKKRRHAERMRLAACQLAAQVVSTEQHDTSTQKASRLMSWCIFFDCYIVRGAGWTEKHMRLMDQASKERARAGGELVSIRGGRP